MLPELLKRCKLCDNFMQISDSESRGIAVEFHPGTRLRTAIDSRPSMHKEPDQSFNLSAFLPYRFSVLSNRISTTIAKLYSERFDLTIPEWRIIVILSRYPGISAADLTHHTEMDKVAVSRAVTRLLKKARITRTVALDDRRRSVLNLSDEGKQIVAEIMPLALAYESELTRVISESDLQTLHGLIEKLTRQAESLKYSKDVSIDFTAGSSQSSD